jgi:hypothetical protein
MADDDLRAVVKSVMQTVGVLMESQALLMREVYERADWLSPEESRDRVARVEHAREVLELAMQKLESSPPFLADEQP